MTRQKTSRAVIESARLNPIHEKERRAIEILTDLYAQGFNFKQVVVDAILRASGHTPEMFTKEEEQFDRLIKKLEDQQVKTERMIALAVQQIVSAAPSRPVRNGDGDDFDEDDEGVSPFARKFAQGFMQRQSQALGDEDDD